MITIMLPAYNEAENLPPLLENVHATMEGYGADYRILVVDDGSSDDTPHLLKEFARKMPIVVVRHEVNQGLAQTLRDGLAIAVKDSAPDDVLVTMDADNTHDPRLIPTILGRLDQGFDVVIASRYRPGGKEIGLSLDRKILSLGANILLQVCFPTKGVRDFTCGYRAYRIGIVRRAWQTYGDRLIEATTFACMAEVLLKLRAIGMRAAEVPLVLRYDLKGGASKMRVIRTIINYGSVVSRTWRMQWSPRVRQARQRSLQGRQTQGRVY